MTRLGVFGGSFDPPHRTHERVARAALDQLHLDAVLWIPAAHPPHKPDRTLTADPHRMAMIRGVIEDEPRFRLDTRELDRGGTSWTVQTLESLTAEQPDATLFLIVGSDNLAGFETWRDPDRIAELATLVVYDRPDTSASALRRSNGRPAIHLDGIQSDISSTAIRQALQAAGAGEGTDTTVSGLLRTHLHPRTLSYIRAHGLYLPE
ncbi:MAG: nicotinate (nicotinamide) nucleotide adenylyltransferase [Rhodothermales bacterium]